MMVNKDTQLPAEVEQKIHADTNILYDQLDGAARDVDFYEFGLPQVDRQTEPIRNLLTEYATKLHQAEQEKDRVLKSAIRYALDKDELENKLAALQAKCERYQKSLEKISRTSYLVGQPGCTWCDTDLDSVAVAAGYNQALDNIVPIANEALSGEGEKGEFADLQKHIMGGKGDEDRTDNLTKKEDKQ
jgi:hypothetical protein